MADDRGATCETAVYLVASFGFSGLDADLANSVIPIAYYLMKRGLGQT